MATSNGNNCDGSNEIAEDALVQVSVFIEIVCRFAVFDYFWCGFAVFYTYPNHI